MKATIEIDDNYNVVWKDGDRDIYGHMNFCIDRHPDGTVKNCHWPMFQYETMGEMNDDVWYEENWEQVHDEVYAHYYTEVLKIPVPATETQSVQDVYEDGKGY